MQVSAGVSYVFGETVTAAFELTWFNWPDLGSTQISLVPQELLSVPLTDELDLLRITLGRIRPEPRVEATFVPRFGLEWKALGDVLLRAGYYYEPAGFSNRGDETQVLEPDRHVASLGMGVVVSDPFELGDPMKRLTVDGFVQYQFLTGAESSRFTADGRVTSIGAAIAYRF